MNYRIATYIILLFITLALQSQEYDADNVHPKVNENINKLINKQVTLNQLENQHLIYEQSKFKTLMQKDTNNTNNEKLQKELNLLDMKSIIEINYSFGTTNDSKKTEVYQCEIKYKLRKVKKTILIYFAKQTGDTDFYFNGAKFGD